MSSSWFSRSSPSSISSLLIIMNIAMLFITTTKALFKIPSDKTVPALIVFGDSIMDTGNNNMLSNTIIKSNFPPYGIDFQGKTPTGRFCDGKVPTDLIAEELGIKPLVPAYLDPNLTPEDLITGVCFASSGSGYDPLTAQIARVISLAEQLKYFEEYIEKLKGIVGEERKNFILENSLFLLVSSSNDIATTYYSFHARDSQYDVDSYTTLMVNYASDFIHKLYGYGARRIGVYSAPPLGCLPSQRTVAGGITRDCDQIRNEASMLFNSKLSASLDYLTTTLPKSRVVYVDVYSLLLEIIQNPRKYGFEVVDRGCCGTGNIEVAFLCNKYTAFVCPNVSAYVFWDSFHPTERVYRIIVPRLLQRYVNKFL